MMKTNFNSRNGRAPVASGVFGAASRRKRKRRKLEKIDKTKAMKKTIRAAFVKSLPVMAGYLALGFGFGVLAANAGYGPLWALAMSVTIYAGAMQYLAVDLLASQATLTATAIATFMVNARHIFYGVTMIDKYRDAGKYKPYIIFGMTDETYSLTCDGKAPDGLDFPRFAFWLTLFDHLYWIVGGVVGALVGTLVEFDSRGVDFAMTALFIAVFVEQWKGTRRRGPALVGVAVSVLCLLAFGPDNFLIPATLGICAVLIGGRRFFETKKEAEAPTTQELAVETAEKEEKR